MFFIERLETILLSQMETCKQQGTIETLTAPAGSPVSQLDVLKDWDGM